MNRTRHKMMGKLLLLMLSVLLLAGRAAASAQIPNVQLKFTVQRLEEGKLDERYHVWRLTCDLGTCRLIVLTVGGCFGDAFYPVIETWSTEQSTLKVVNQPDNVLHLRITDEHWGEVVTPARIGYADPFTILGYTWYRRVSSFSGAAVKHSSVLEKVITWELVPLMTFVDHKRVKLNCPYILLPAIEEVTHNQLSEMLRAGDKEQIGHRLDRYHALAAQRRLKAAGFDPGPIDGKLGGQTKAALRKYQAQHGLAVTGELDEPTRSALGIE